MVLREKYFNVPAKLSFRPFRAKWISTQAEVVDYWEDPAWLPKPLTLPRSPTLKGSLRESNRKFEKYSARERLQVRISVPSMAHGSVVRPRLFGPSYSVTVYRDELPMDILQPHENRRTCPDISGRFFDVLACPTSEVGNVLPIVNPRPGDVTKDVDAMRDDFFKLEETSQDLCRFMNRWGIWNGELGYLTGLGFEAHPFVLCLPHRIWGDRKKYKDALVGDPLLWLKSARPLALSSIAERPYFSVECSTCEDAIKATISIDLLAGLKFGICHRCGDLFRCKTSHKKDYCSRKCIQAAGTARWRAKQKKNSITKKGKADAKG